MTHTPCIQEERVREALVHGSLPPDLLDHVAVCPVCREAVAVSSWMRELRSAAVQESAAAGRLPDARAILERARRRSIPREIDVPKILKPLRVYQSIALPFGLGAGIIIAVLNASPLKRLLLSLPGLQTLISGFGLRPAGMGADSLGIFVALAGLGLLTIFALAAAMGMKRAER